MRPNAGEPLPDDIESHLVDLRDAPTQAFWLGVEKLCAAQPTHAPAIRQRAAALEQDEALRPDDTAAGAGSRPAPTSLPARIGPYRILSQLGAGGMGEVFLAEHPALGTRVALKVIKLGMDTRAFLARFDAERAALSRMQHTNIAKVFDAGVTQEGRPYFAMEYIRGIPITRYCDDNRLSIEDRIELVQQVCSGVQHAHSKGVIHRDLTPNNVLVTLEDGHPTAKIIDFGLAKATEHNLTAQTVFTEQGVILGTPEYMSPEQAGRDGLDIDTRTDVYTVGVMLYELLSGALPFSSDELRKAGLDALCKTIRDKEPAKPSTRVTKAAQGSARIAELRRTEPHRLLKRLRGDLDWVVLKCLEKDRTRRYETPTHLADDLQRHLECEPVVARGPSARYRLLKLAQRYRGQLVASCVVFLVLIAGLAGTTWFAWEAKEQAASARRQESIARGLAVKESEQRARADAAAAEAKRKTEQLALKATELEAASAAAVARAKDADAAAKAADAHRQRADDNAREVEASATRARELLRRLRPLECLLVSDSLDKAMLAHRSLAPYSLPQATAMRRWLDEDVERLIKAKTDVRDSLAYLRTDALPPTPEDIEHDRALRPRFAEWQRAAAKLGSLERAHAIRNGQAVLALPPPTPQEVVAEPGILNDFAFKRVTFEEHKRIWGEEARALTLAKLAWEKAHDAGTSLRATIADTLAWAWFANGKDTEALAQCAQALSLAPAARTAEYQGFQVELQKRVAAASGAGATESLAALRQEIDRLDESIATRSTYRFAEEQQQSVHDRLSELLGKIESLEAHECRDVRARLAAADMFGAMTENKPAVRARWESARAALAKADGISASEAYRKQPIDLRPQTGLVPIGMNPETKLWEFYDLGSAWDPDSDEKPADIVLPKHDDRGRVIARGGGIVFVLLPGGSSFMGAQSRDKDGPNYDRDARDLEAVAFAALAPFFMARHELTVAQWRRLTAGATQARDHGDASASGMPARNLLSPMGSVAWTECAQWLSHHGLCLPTEAQWEYACRAGTSSPWTCALDELAAYANLADASAKRMHEDWQCEAWDDRQPWHASVGTFRANAFGLHDMHGNLWEWTADGLGDLSAAPRDGDGLRVAPKGEMKRIVKGGGCNSAAPLARSAYRDWHEPEARLDFLGVRPARQLQR